MAAQRNQYQDTAIVTGGTVSIGYYCAEEIARRQPHTQVIIASRSSADNAAARINNTLRQSNVVYIPLDLSSLENVREFVSKYESAGYPPVSALVLNAGLQFPGPVQYTTDGIENTFAVAHVGHALLFHLLVPHLKPDARIVLTTSSTHDPAMKTGMPDADYISAEILAHPDEATKKDPGRKRYTQAKLCNVLWTYALDRHAKSVGKQWTVTTMDPGLMPGTGLLREYSPVFQFLWYYILPWLVPITSFFTDYARLPSASGKDLASLAADDKHKGVSAKYFSGPRELKSSTLSYDEEKQEDLWFWTAKNISKGPEEAKRFLELK